jgi:hypothetical protein
MILENGVVRTPHRKTRPWPASSSDTTSEMTPKTTMLDESRAHALRGWAAASS